MALKIGKFFRRAFDTRKALPALVTGGLTLASGGTYGAAALAGGTALAKSASFGQRPSATVASYGPQPGIPQVFGNLPGTPYITRAADQGVMLPAVRVMGRISSRAVIRARSLIRWIGITAAAAALSLTEGQLGMLASRPVRTRAKGITGSQLRTTMRTMRKMNKYIEQTQGFCPKPRLTKRK